jgi:hypothetical protein
LIIIHFESHRFDIYSSLLQFLSPNEVEIELG